MPDAALLDRLNKLYTRQSGITSDVARQVAFGAAAICWFFKTDGLTFPQPVLAALVTLAVYFLVDFLQYYQNTLRYHSLYLDYREERLDKACIPDRAEQIQAASAVFFHIKLVLLLTVYGCIAVQFFRAWGFVS